MCESISLGSKLFSKAAETEDSVKRAALTVVALGTAFATTKFRKRKPFNPMLGETFEYVTEDFRFLAEKVMHIPM